MNFQKLKNKNIALLGLGSENYALALFLLKKKIPCQLTVCHSGESIPHDERFMQLKNKIKRLKFITKANQPETLDNFDILMRSPGWPLFCPAIKSAQKKNKKLIVYSPMRLFFDLCPTKNIIGVTGTKGKGTTSSIIYQILKTASKKVFLGGNIGVAPFSFIEKIKKYDYVVLELSSFQLEDFKCSPRLAVITNLSPEHLAPADPNNPNYHHSLTDYYQSKLNIIRWQKKQDFAVLNKKIEKYLKKIKFKTASHIIYFNKSNLSTPLVGQHNQENIAAAEMVAQILKIKKSIIEQAVKNFHGLEHRLEFVQENKGTRYYDDSFATTPASTIIALKSFKEPIILIAGGADKGANFLKLAKEIKKRVKNLILFPGIGTNHLLQELKKDGFPEEKIKIASSMDSAVKLSSQLAKKREVVLLSPACASFGLFANYKERGQLFKEAIKKLKT